MKVLISRRYDQSYYTPFAKFGECVSDPTILDKDPKSVALVVFTGGEDVDPKVYGEARNPKTYCNPHRDAEEMAIFKRARELNIPIVGICRGSQFLCAMAGGKLVQHLVGHSQYHNVRTDDGRLIMVSSTHHQMQLPPKDAIPLAWAEPRLSKVYEGPAGVNYEPELEYDCVYYPNINAIGMQYHPEYMDSDTEGFQYAGELVKRYFQLPELAK